MPNALMSRDAITLLRNQHKEVEALFKKCEKLTKGEQPSQELHELCQQILSHLRLHTSIEEQIFYPAMKQALTEGKMLYEAFEEHHVVKMVMSELERLDTVDARFNAKLKVLIDLVRHHVQEEEGQLFPQCREACGRKLMREIGATMVSFEKQLMKDPNLKLSGKPEQMDELMQRVSEMSSHH